MRSQEIVNNTHTHNHTCPQQQTHTGQVENTEVWNQSMKMKVQKPKYRNANA